MMKVKVDKPKLRRLMRDRGYKSFDQLGEQCGLSPCIWNELNRTGTLSKESMFLISEELKVAINDFIFPEW